MQHRRGHNWHERCRAPYAEARLLQVRACRYAERGKLEPARERLAIALAIVRQLGTRKNLERTEQSLSHVG